MPQIEYTVVLKLDALTRADDELLKLPIKISYIIEVGYLTVRCDSAEEAEKYLNHLREVEIKSREVKSGQGRERK